MNAEEYWGKDYFLGSYDWHDFSGSFHITWMFFLGEPSSCHIQLTPSISFRWCTRFAGPNMPSERL